jgi:hypothetical protein
VVPLRNNQTRCRFWFSLASSADTVFASVFSECNLSCNGCVSSGSDGFVFLEELVHHRVLNDFSVFIQATLFGQVSHDILFNAHLHYHIVVLDGVFAECPEGKYVPNFVSIEITDKDIEALVQRISRSVYQQNKYY